MHSKKIIALISLVISIFVFSVSSFVVFLAIGGAGWYSTGLRGPYLILPFLIPIGLIGSIYSFLMYEKFKKIMEAQQEITGGIARENYTFLTLLKSVGTFILIVLVAGGVFLFVSLSFFLSLLTP